MGSLKAASSLAVAGRLHPGDVLGKLSGSTVGKAHTSLWGLAGGHSRRPEDQVAAAEGVLFQEATTAC